MRIAFAVSEVEDLVKTGGLADVGKSLPLELCNIGHDVRIIMPLYKDVGGVGLENACPPQSIEYHGRRYDFQVKQAEFHGTTVYFIEHDDYFDRDGLYSDGYDAFDDNGQRFAFFSQAVLYALSAVNFIPEVLHANDWHTAMIPYFLKHASNQSIKRDFTHCKSVLTIHNAAFQGVFLRRDVDLLADEPTILNYSHGDYVNFLQTGLVCCDHITTVSPNYANELLTDLGSHGLSPLLQTRANAITGILNGCDYSQWDPSTDKYIAHNFSRQNLTGKKACKQALQAHAKLPEAADIPVLGMVCRLTEQKGFGYILPILERLLQHRVQLVIVGTGDPGVVKRLSQLSAKFDSKFHFMIGFSNQYAHWIEAGSDFFLMPSQFEPCGLNQMYSLAYGTVPIVREVGGLKDTVIDVEMLPDESTGFCFQAPQAEALLHCIRRALLTYYESPDALSMLQQRGMQTRFTWRQAAVKYETLYQELSHVD
jgi:starch synthase